MTQNASRWVREWIAEQKKEDWYLWEVDTEGIHVEAVQEACKALVEPL